MDEKRYRASTLLYHARSHFETNSDLALSILEEGRQLAAQIPNPCLTLDYDHWICDLLIFYRGEYGKALDIATRALIESRKPVYQHCTEKIDIYRVVMDAYLYNDPVGFELEITDTANLIETTMNPTYDLWCLMQWARGYLQLALGQLDSALEAAQIYLERSQRSQYRIVDSYSLLCEVHFHRGDLEAVRTCAEVGESYALKAGSVKRWLLEFLAWQAWIAQKSGDEHKAQQYYLRATTQQVHMTAKPYLAFYDGLCAYHEAKNENNQVLLLRNQQFQEVQASGSPYLLAECYLRRCQLMAHLEKPITLEWEAAHQAAARLKKPTLFLQKLQNLRISYPNAFEN